MKPKLQINAETKDNNKKKEKYLLTACLLFLNLILPPEHSPQAAAETGSSKTAAVETFIHAYPPVEFIGLDMNVAPLACGESKKMVLYWRSFDPLDTAFHYRFVLKNPQSVSHTSFHPQMIMLKAERAGISIKTPVIFKPPLKIAPGPHQLFLEPFQNIPNSHQRTESESFYQIYLGPVEIKPCFFDAKTDDQALRQTFGPDIAPLNKGIVLGPPGIEAMTELNLERSYSHIGILTVMETAGDIPQGMPVASLQVSGRDGNSETLLIRAGVHTQQGYGRAGSEGSKIKHAGARKAAYFHDQDNQRSDYPQLFYAELPLPGNMIPENIKLTYLSDIGILHVQDIVFIE